MRLIKITRAMVVVLWCVTTTTAMAEVSIAAQTLRYAVTYQNLHAGELEIGLTPTADGYTVVAAAHLSKLAALFLPKHRSETFFTRRGDEVVLSHGREFVNGSDAAAHTFEIDYARRQIIFSNDKQTEFETDMEFEAAAFPLALMLRPINAIAGVEVMEVSGKRARRYRYEKPEAVRVQTAAGEVPSWKIVRRRVDRPSDRVSVWLQQTANPIPLKISIAKKGRISELKLLPPAK